MARRTATRAGDRGDAHTPGSWWRDVQLRLVAVSFAVNGLLYGSLLSRYADLAGTLGASEAAFGLALTAGAVGGLVGSVAAPLVVRALGQVAALTIAGCVYAAMAPLVVASPLVVVLGAGLFVAGVVDGAHDVGVNALAVRVQQRRGAAVMGRVHALWSLALAGGAAAGAAAASVGLPVVVHLLGVAAVAGAAQLSAGVSARLQQKPAATDPAPASATGGAGDSAPTPRKSPGDWRAPHARILLLAVVAAAVAASYVEGPGQDWSALLLARGFAAEPGMAASAPLTFSVGLLTARLALDPLTARVPRWAVACTAAAVVVAGGAAGAVVAWADGPAWSALALLFLLGLGAGPAYPMLFGAADVLADRYGISASVTASVISTCSRVGAISAPAAVGALASATGTPIIFAVMAAGGLLLLLTLPRALR